MTLNKARLLLRHGVKLFALLLLSTTTEARDPFIF